MRSVRANPLPTSPCKQQVNFFPYDAAEYRGKPLLEGGLRAGYNWDLGRREVALYARHLTDKRALIGAIDDRPRHSRPPYRDAARKVRERRRAVPRASSLPRHAEAPGIPGTADQRPSGDRVPWPAGAPRAKEIPCTPIPIARGTRARTAACRTGP